MLPEQTELSRKSPAFGHSKNMNRTSAKRIAALILILGFGTALGVYVTSDPADSNPAGYDPMQDRKYLHDMEMYGGQANVMAAQFRNWFDSLWHGQALAGTIAVLTIIGTIIFWWLATLPRPEDHSPPA